MTPSAGGGGENDRPRRMAGSLPSGLTETPDLHGAFPRLSDEQVESLSRVGQRQPTHPGEVLYEEGEAVNRGLDLLGEDDLLVIHADKVPGTLAIVRERAVQGT